MNPFLPPYTAYQHECIRAGRARLLSDWKRAPFVASSMQLVVDDDVELDDDNRVYDVFRATNAPDVFPEAWARDVARRAFTVKHQTRGFHVRVPHEYYLQQRWCCTSVTQSCTLNVVQYAVVIGCLARLAYLLS